MKARLAMPLALLLMLVAMAALPATASAATVIQCVGQETSGFSPGLTLKDADQRNSQAGY